MENSTILKVVAAALVIAGLSTFIFFTYVPVSSSPLLWETGGDDPVLEYYPDSNGAFLVKAGNVSWANSSSQALWTIPLASPKYSALGSDGLLYVYTEKSGLWRFSRDGQAHALGFFAFDRPPVVDRNGSFYLRNDTRLTGYTRESSVMFSDPWALSDPVQSADGSLTYLATRTGQPGDIYLRSRSPEGHLQWSSLVANYDHSTVIMVLDSGLYVARTEAGELSRYMENGTILWKYYKPYLGQYLLSSDGQGQIYLVYSKGTVHVLSEEGDLFGKFSAEIPDSTAIDSVAAANGSLYLAVRDSMQASADITAMDLNGTRLWARSVNSTESVLLLPACGGVYAAAEITRGGSTIPTIYMLDKTGDLRYVFSAPHPGSWASCKTGGSTFYARTQDGRLYAFNMG